MRVHPAMVPADSLLANINDEFNAIEVVGSAVGNQVFYGKGAGQMPTASAVVSDMVAVVERKADGASPAVGDMVLGQEALPVAPVEQIQMRYFLRMQVCDLPGVLEHIARILAGEEISIASVLQKERDVDGGLVPLVIVTHEAREESVQRATGAIASVEAVQGAVRLIRMEELTGEVLVLVPDGAADYPLEALGGRLLWKWPTRRIWIGYAREGCGGTVCMIPPERHPGSDVGNLEIFGYDTRIHYTGRSPLEAASMGVDLGPDGVAFRLNTIHRQEDTLVDYSAGHISTEEASALVQSIAAELGRPDVRFYPGVSYRHLLVFDNGPEGLVSYPPHDIMGQSVSAHLPSGEGEASIRALMEQAEPILAEHPVNKRRAERGEPTANAIWLWGSGRALKLKSLTEKFGFSGGVISAVDLVRGIGRSAGLSVVEVPGITGYLDTNYEGKAQHALDVLARDNFA